MKKIISGIAAAAVLSATLLAATPAEAASKRITFYAKSSNGYADVSYYGAGASASLDDEPTTWVKKVKNTGFYYSVDVSDFSGDYARVECVIKNAKGKTVDRNVASGTYVSASCSYMKG